MESSPFFVAALCARRRDRELAEDGETEIFQGVARGTLRSADEWGSRSYTAANWGIGAPSLPLCVLGGTGRGGGERVLSMLEMESAVQI
jgi:hypothetical protein